MPLNQEQQLQLSRILEDPTFKAAQEEVLRMTDGSLDGLLAPEAGIKMANEKGVRNAFRLLRKLADPNTPYVAPKPKSSLTR